MSQHAKARKRERNRIAWQNRSPEERRVIYDRKNAKRRVDPVAKAQRILAREKAEQAKAGERARKEAERAERRLTARQRANRLKVIRWRQRYDTDPVAYITACCRRRISNMVRTQGKNCGLRTQELIGCSYEQFKKHIEKQFKRGMSWDNKGQWHIDHIRPLASFDLLKPEEQRRAFHFTNCQPLWNKDNWRKHDHWDGQYEFIADAV